MNLLDHAAPRRNLNPHQTYYLNPHHQDFDVPLTRGGAAIRQRVFRPNSTCNAIAALAGIGQREVL